MNASAPQLSVNCFMLILFEEFIVLSLRALLLSGGYGSRLLPLTNTLPKCLVRIGGIPIIEHWLNQLDIVGCESILVNTHYLSKQVVEYLFHIKSRYICQIETVHEEKLLGTAGTLCNNLNFFDNGVSLLIHADNLMIDKLEFLIEAHLARPTHCLLTMLTFETSDPSSCGIVCMDNDGVVQHFHEKSKSDNGYIANGAVYCFDSDLLKYISEMHPQPVDFSLDVIPAIIGRMYTYHTSMPFVDIGSPERLQAARQIFESHSRLNCYE